MAEIFDWLKPAPFWEKGGAITDSADLIRPALLEFRTDRFMDDFLAEATSGRDSDWQQLQSQTAIPGAKPLRLYQPAHMRYYLLCASLCCREPGFPDRVVRRAQGESIFFVLRKVNAQGQEYGWSVEGTSKAWQAVEGSALAANEERLPLFTTAPCCGRSVVYGYVPVASRDTYKQAVPITDPNPALEQQQRLAQFDENITRTLAQLVTGTPPEAIFEQLSLFLLSDLSDFFQSYLPNVYTALRDNHAITAPGVEKNLYDHLAQMKVQIAGSNGVFQDRAATEGLNRVIAAQAQIALLSGGDPLPLMVKLKLDTTWFQNSHATDLRAFVQAAMPTPVSDPTRTQETDLPKLTVAEGERFLIRCVYERPCDAPFPPRLRISQPTYLFDMAPFFDTDAPARPIRIEMPTDVSIAAMRKFQKGVGFSLSNAMRNKMNMVTGNEKKLLTDGTAGSEGTWGLGMICSFSLQIVFIVAFMLLLIFVFVLNIVFWWLPFFRICLPIPKKGN